ncbi:MAG: hypothetical protein HN570_05950, partial [Verrucomicrobia bacterium]|nr:hypothetical protein [Verrucomicrobiota bacterium]
MKTYQTLVVALTAGTLTLISCSPIQQPYDLGGAAAGAALSNNTAGNRNDIARSAAPGGAAGTGYAVYRERQNQNNGTYPNGSYTVAPPTTAPAPITTAPAPITTAPAPITTAP